MRRDTRRDRDSYRPQKPRVNIARLRTLEILERVENDNAYASILVSNLLKDESIEPRDARLVQRLVLGVLETRGDLDATLDPLVRGGFESLPAKLRQVLRIGAYQIIHLDKIPKEIAVYESVELARSATKNPGLVKLVNAVLRKVDKNSESSAIQQDEFESNHREETSYQSQERHEVVAREQSHPAWLVKRWIERFGENETIELCKANNTRWPLCIRVNTALVERDVMLRHLAKDGVIGRPTRYSQNCATIEALPAKKRIDQLPSFQLGEWLVQDESSSLVVDLLDPQPGERVLDLCCAPGGKTTDIAARVGIHGEVIALDRSATRLELVKENADRLGLKNIELVEGDGTTFKSPTLFDRVLADVPCSGIGVIGRKKEIRWNKDVEIFAELRQAQLDLLNNAARLVKIDGEIVYSTCSIEPEEDEAIVESFLKEHGKNFIRVSPGSLLKKDLTTKQGYLRTFPHKHGMGGAFAALLKRVA